MTDTTLEPRFADELRRELVLHARTSRPPRRRRFAAVAAALLATGLTITAANVAVGSRSLESAAVPLARPIIVTHVGPEVVPLPRAPRGATHLLTMFQCFSPGPCGTGASGTTGVTWSNLVRDVQGSGDSFRLTDKVDAANPQVIPPLDPAKGLQITAGNLTAWRLYAVYTDDRQSDWMRNGRGKTYGVPYTPGKGTPGVPDLLSVFTTDGKFGYTPTEALLGRTASPSFTNDAQVQAYAAQAHHPQSLPVYEADGKTLIGHLDID